MVLVVLDELYKLGDVASRYQHGIIAVGWFSHHVFPFQVTIHTAGYPILMPMLYVIAGRASGIVNYFGILHPFIYPYLKG